MPAKVRKYRCGNCNYVFIPKGDRVPNRCPYCSKGNIMLDSQYFSLSRELDNGPNL